MADSSRNLPVNSGMASYAGVVGSSPTENEQKFVPLSFIHNPPYLYLILDLLDLVALGVHFCASANSSWPKNTLRYKKMETTKQSAFSHKKCRI